jgi:integrase
MKLRFKLFRRGPVFYSEDAVTGKQISLRAKAHEGRGGSAHLVAREKRNAPSARLEPSTGQTYLSAVDPAATTRTWQTVMDEYVRTKHGTTQARCRYAVKDVAFDSIKTLKLVETQPAHLPHVLEAGTVSTNVFLRRLHSFALGMNWLPWPVLSKKQWPAIRYEEKRAITAAEHAAFLSTEQNAERHAYYEMSWHLGGAQSDVAMLEAKDVDWSGRVVSFTRMKTKSVQIIQFGAELEALLRTLPTEGPLFPKLSLKHEGNRAADFTRVCRRAKVEGVSLHSYRYAWAERAKTAGYPERFAQVALGHASKAVHRA